MKKTEPLLICPDNSPNLPLSVVSGQNEIHFQKSVCKLGVIYDVKVSMKQVNRA